MGLKPKHEIDTPATQLRYLEVGTIAMISKDFFVIRTDHSKKDFNTPVYAIDLETGDTILNGDMKVTKVFAHQEEITLLVDYS